MKAPATVVLPKFTQRSLFAAALAVMSGLAASASGDIISVNVELNAEPSTSLELTGQSSLFKTTTDGFSTGGLLDGVTSPGAGIDFEEVFPPPTLDDYQFFGYYGRVLTRNDAGDITDTSLIMAFRQGEGAGHRIGDYFVAYTESQLVAAFADFDSVEFLDLLSGVSGNVLTRGTIEVQPIGRPGETLDLIAFTGGVDGDLGVVAGSLTYSVVPASGSLSLFLAGCALTARRRR